ncbi:hypothetical protein [Halobacteriovorax sp. RT-2-6]|uniref:hypothetical protein n=1 Tax=unclassified Halobacteriovorax TaxID=2639665 RepID=UPI0039997ACB
MLRLITIALVSISTFAICQKWSEPQVIGRLDNTVLNETSGIAISQIYDDRMYNLNDSGSGPEIFWTTLTGKNTKKVKINNFRPYDMEDMSLGPCGEQKCVYIADIGDNKKKRKFLSVVALNEAKLKDDTKEIDPEFVLRLVYPNKEKYDAESMVVHPSGDIYILTKIVDEENRRAMPAKLFKIEKEKIQEGVKKEEKMELKEVAIIDLPFHLYNYNLWGRIATAMDISKDGKTLLVLTYGAVFEFNIEFNSLAEFNSRKLEAKTDFRIVRTKELPQQEAIAYGPKDNEFIYTTEVESGDGVSEIVRHVCE